MFCVEERNQGKRCRCDRLCSEGVLPISRASVTNAGAYNLSLKKRGMISLYFPSGELKVQFINARPYTRGVSGREPTYTEGYIELIYTFYRLFGWGMRQITGYMVNWLLVFRGHRICL